MKDWRLDSMALWSSRFGVSSSQHHKKDFSVSGWLSVSGRFAQTQTLSLLSSHDILSSVSHYTAALPASPVWCPKFNTFIQKRGEKGKRTSSLIEMYFQGRGCWRNCSESQHFLSSRFRLGNLGKGLKKVQFMNGRLRQKCKEGNSFTKPENNFLIIARDWIKE